MVIVLHDFSTTHTVCVSHSQRTVVKEEVNNMVCSWLYSLLDCRPCCLIVIIPPPRGIKRWCCLTSDVCLTSVAYIGPKSRTERPRKTKIGKEVAHITHMTRTPLSRSKVQRSTCYWCLKYTGTGATWRINTKILSTCRPGRGHIVPASRTACFILSYWVLRTCCWCRWWSSRFKSTD